MGVETAPPAYGGQPQMAQPQMVQPVAAAPPSQIGCPGCQAVIGIPPGTPPGGQLQCPTCQTVMAVPGAAAPAPAAGPNIIISNNQQVSGYGGGYDEAASARTLFCLGFFFGFIWLYNFVKHFKSSDPQAVMFARVSLGCFIAEVILWIILYSTVLSVGRSYYYINYYYYYG